MELKPQKIMEGSMAFMFGIPIMLRLEADLQNRR